MAKLEITASNLPTRGSGLSILCSTMLTRESPANRSRAASSIAGEKSTATASVSGCSRRTSASSRPSPVPRSRILLALAAMNSSKAVSPSPRCEIKSARSRYSRACCVSVQRLTGFAFMRATIAERINSFLMENARMAHRRVLRSILWLVLVASIELTAGGAQNQQNQPPAQPPSHQQPTKPIPPPDQAQPPEQQQPEVKITPRQAEELFHSVDEILEFDSKQTGLPVKHNVKRKLTSRDEVVAYLTKHMNDEDTRRLRRSELVLKKFGLLPRNFDLQTFLVALLKEEVAGYYDPKTKTVNLLDWVPIEEQEPVMAHELTHALQDQDINLQKFMKAGDKDLGEIKHDPTPDEIENDEMDNAREAVVEGQAQAIMFQYAIAPTGHSIVNSPSLVDAMEEESMTGTPNTKVFNDAPIFLKESLTFPYSYGMDFVIKLLQQGGKHKAFGAVLQNPPHTTRQIMQPETYLSGEKLEPMRVPDFKRDFKDYQKFDVGAMGEFDVAVLI